MRDYYIFSKFGGRMKTEQSLGGFLKLTIEGTGVLIGEPLILADHLEELATYIRRFHGKGDQGKLQGGTKKEG